MEIIEIYEEDWKSLREIKIEAAKDCPAAFALTVEELVEKDEKYWRCLFSKARIFLLTSNGNSIGCARLFRDTDGTWSVGSLWVAAEHRHKGVGRKLLLHVLNLAKEMKVKYVELGVNASLSRARTLYESVGFRESKVIKDIKYADGAVYDELILCLSLDSIAEQ